MPVLVVGWFILFSAILLMAKGGTVWLWNSLAFDLWVLVVGFGVSVGGLVVALYAVSVTHRTESYRETSQTRSGRSSTPSAAFTIPQSAVVEAAVEAPRPSEPLRNLLPEVSPPVGTSIASALAAAAEEDPTEPNPLDWTESTEALSGALPFSAGGQVSWRRHGSRSTRRGREGSFGELQREVEQLRLRVRELEDQRDGRSTSEVQRPKTEPSRSTASRTLLPEPPAFQSNSISGPRACVSCSKSLPSGSPGPLCWGCGRPLCTDCFWRHSAGQEPHRCPSCLARRSVVRQASQLESRPSGDVSGPGSETRLAGAF